MKYQTGEYVAVHTEPLWRDRANLVFAAHQGTKNGKNEWEQLWGREVTAKRCIVCCIPFFIKDVALGDEVEIDYNFTFQRVVLRSGQVTFRAWFGGNGTVSKREIVSELESMQLMMEWSSENLLALSVHSINTQALADYLNLQEQRGLLHYDSAVS